MGWKAGLLDPRNTVALDMCLEYPDLLHCTFLIDLVRDFNICNGWVFRQAMRIQDRPERHASPFLSRSAHKYFTHSPVISFP